LYIFVDIFGIVIILATCKSSLFFEVIKVNVIGCFRVAALGIDLLYVPADSFFLRVVQDQLALCFGEGDDARSIELYHVFFRGTGKLFAAFGSEIGLFKELGKLNLQHVLDELLVLCLLFCILYSSLEILALVYFFLQVFLKVFGSIR
jgi:hypothetical protein